MKTIIFFLLFLIVVISNAQIETTYYFDAPKPSKFDETLNDFGEESTYNTFFITPENIKSNNNGLVKYGDVIPVDINLKKSGKWYNKKTWKLLIVSPNAKTIELVFDKVILPKGTELNIYDINKNMVFGPIMNENIVEGYPISTDIILGDSIIVQLDLAENIMTDEVDFSIVKIIHGFKDILGIENKLKSAGSCQVDVECTAGDGWETETEGTAKIYGNGTVGSCALLNNTAQDFTPYILTAKHVIDGIGINNASVRFNYKATTCNGSTAASGITISGFNLRANNAVCDLALIEGVQDLSNQSSITFLGWNRNPSPTSVVCLHHPDGDFMSISKESNSISFVSSVWVTVKNWDIGSIEPGSSGSPLFDQDKRVIAATSYINSVDYVCTSLLESGHGKLSYFWPSISSFLDPCNTNATKINSIKVNSSLGTISGSNTVCAFGANFSFYHSLGDAPVTWNLTPTSLFNSPTSGTGSNPTIYAISNNNSGSGQITFNVGCKSFSKTVWVGKPKIEPQTPLAFYPNGGYNNVCNFQNFTTNMVVNGATNVTWERIAANPSNTSWSQSGNNISFYFWAVNQTAVYRISASNVCGTTSYDFGFKSINCGTDPCATDYLVSPNPTSSGLITIVPNIPPPCDTYLSEPSIQEISIYDNNGTLKKAEKYGKKTGSAEINTSDLLSGVYVVVIDDGKNKVRKTIIVKK